MPEQTEKPSGETAETEAKSGAPRLSHALNALHRDVNHLFNRFITATPFHAPAWSSHPVWADFGFPSPAADVTEGDTAFRIAVELPGVAESDIELSIGGDTLLLKGEKKEDKEEKRGTVHIFERNFGAFQRSFHLPGNVDRDHISAKFDKGVLVITLQKLAPAAAKPEKIAIKIG